MYLLLFMMTLEEGCEKNLPKKEQQLPLVLLYVVLANFKPLHLNKTYQMHNQN